MLLAASDPCLLALFVLPEQRQERPEPLIGFEQSFGVSYFANACIISHETLSAPHNPALHNKKVLSVLRNHRALLCSVVFFAGNVVFAQSNSSQLPDGPGKETVQKICSGCHAPQIVLGHRDTKEGWAQIVSNMVEKGANGTDEEFNTIIDYLAAHFPKSSDTQPQKK